jgi:hypothetical protein
VSELAWKNVDLDVHTLLSFERPASKPALLLACDFDALALHLENSIAATTVFFTIKRLRAHGGCLGARSRRRTWAAAISPGEELTIL